MFYVIWSRCCCSSDVV